MSPEKTFIFNSHFRMFSATRGDFFVAKKKEILKSLFLIKKNIRVSIINKHRKLFIKTDVKEIFINHVMNEVHNF